MSMVPGGLPCTPPYLWPWASEGLCVELLPSQPWAVALAAFEGDLHQELEPRGCRKSQASPLFFFLGLGRTTTPSRPWGTHMLVSQGL